MMGSTRVLGWAELTYSMVSRGTPPKDGAKALRWAWQGPDPLRPMMLASMLAPMDGAMALSWAEFKFQQKLAGCDSKGWCCCVSLSRVELSFLELCSWLR